MKKPRWVMSVSLGSSERDHEASVTLLGQEFKVQRCGTDGDMARAIEILKKYDGVVDAFGLGGVDMYLFAKAKKGWKRYTLRDGMRLAAIPKITPVVDGSGLKHSLEIEVIQQLVREQKVPITGKRVLLVSAVDRPGMYQAFQEAGCHITCGDLPFALDIPITITSQRALGWLAFVLMPIVSRLPHHMLYPVGKEQEVAPNPKYASYYNEADIIAGDFHYIWKSMPEVMIDKTIVTNSVTEQNVQELKRRGVTWLITTTPNFKSEQGISRSYGTNVLEAIMIAILKKPWETVTRQDYLDLIAEMHLEPHIQRLNQ